MPVAFCTPVFKAVAEAHVPPVIFSCETLKASGVEL